jgi:hypothetical protein
MRIPPWRGRVGRPRPQERLSSAVGVDLRQFAPTITVPCFTVHFVASALLVVVATVLWRSTRSYWTGVFLLGAVWATGLTLVLPVVALTLLRRWDRAASEWRPRRALDGADAGSLSLPGEAAGGAVP